MCYLPSSEVGKRACWTKRAAHFRGPSWQVWWRNYIIVETDHHLKKLWTYLEKKACASTWLCLGWSSCPVYLSAWNVPKLCDYAQWKHNLPLDFHYFYLHLEILLVNKLEDKFQWFEQTARESRFLATAWYPQPWASNQFSLWGKKLENTRICFCWKPFNCRGSCQEKIRTFDCGTF